MSRKTVQRQEEPLRQIGKPPAWLFPSCRQKNADSSRLLPWLAGKWQIRTGRRNGTGCGATPISPVTSADCARLQWQREVRSRHWRLRVPPRFPDWAAGTAWRRCTGRNRKRTYRLSPGRDTWFPSAHSGAYCDIAVPPGSCRSPPWPRALRYWSWKQRFRRDSTPPNRNKRSQEWAKGKTLRSRPQMTGPSTKGPHLPSAAGPAAWSGKRPNPHCAKFRGHYSGTTRANPRRCGRQPPWPKPQKASRPPLASCRAGGPASWSTAGWTRTQTPRPPWRSWIPLCWPTWHVALRSHLPPLPNITTRMVSIRIMMSRNKLLFLT